MGCNGLNFRMIEKFVCELYGKGNVTDVNEARCEIFRVTFKMDTLPPNQDSLIYCFTQNVRIIRQEFTGVVSRQS